jgi:hypothetical protein
MLKLIVIIAETTKDREFGELVLIIWHCNLFNNSKLIMLFRCTHFDFTVIVKIT